MEPSLDSFSLAAGGVALSVLFCGMLARSRGYSATFYAALALFLSWGAIPLAVLATREPIRDEEPAELGFTPIAGAVSEGLVDPDLASWRHLYRAIRDSLIFGGIAAAVVAAFGTGLATTSVLPTFVALFEGMSLVLPLPTQFLISVTKFARDPNYAWGFQLVKFSWPALLYLFLQRSGYWLPMLGRVWRQADRLWQIQAMRLYGADWHAHVPAECARRLLGSSEPSLPEDEIAYQAVLRRQREAMQAALWMLLPGVIPILGLMVVLIGAVGMSIFLPLYQISGNIGA